MIRIIPDLLPTKIETPDSLTQSTAPDCDSAAPRTDRLAVWAKVAAWRHLGRVDAVPIDLPDLGIAFCNAPDRIARRDLPMTAATRAAVARCAPDVWVPVGADLP